MDTSTEEYVPKYYEGIQEVIHHRRRQILVHSIIYYSYNEVYVDDAKFDAWARELAKLQKDHPEDSEAVEYMREEFRDWTGETGFHLPLWDKRASNVARHLPNNRKKELENAAKSGNVSV